MRENEKEREELKASCPKKKKLYFMKKMMSLQCFVWGFYSQTPHYKLPKTTTKNYYKGTKREENQIVTKEVKNSKAATVAGNVNSGRILL